MSREVEVGDCNMMSIQMVRVLHAKGTPIPHDPSERSIFSLLACDLQTYQMAFRVVARIDRTLYEVDEWC